MDNKIIEEMARIIAFELCPKRAIHKKWGEEAQCYSDNNFAECKEIKNVVDKLYNAGYRKIPENAVVITEEESVKAWKNGNCNAHAIYGLAYEQARKETAEKFAAQMKVLLSSNTYFVLANKEKLHKAIDEIAKELGESNA